MASIAEMLGVQWDAAPQTKTGSTGYRLSNHAATTVAQTKGYDHAQMLAAANDPGHSYANPLDSRQMVHIHKDHSIAVVVDPKAMKVITAYDNVKETALRPDQVARGAQKGQGRRGGVR